MDTLINMKNNLIQNFYIIGLSPEDFFHIKKNNKGQFLNIFQNKTKINLEPKIITKFPPKNSNFNEVKDEVIVNHCFPGGLNIISIDKENKSPTHFEFELDNLLFNYSNEEKNIYSKIYFTCLEIYEPLIQYFKYKKEIIDINEINKKKKTEIINDTEELNEKCGSTYIPKVICFASVLPFYKELSNILDIIYRLYSGNSNNSVLPIEKLIEQIVLSIPIPLMSNTHIELFFKLNDNNNNNLLNSTSPNFYKINFPLFNIKERNLKLFYTNPVSIIFNYFSIDDIIKIYKYILLEVPILFFSSEKKILSSFIETFISFLSPFEYVLPCISILPKKNYGFISTQKKFLFGINEKYTKGFFAINDIEIDKNIIIVNINNNETDSTIEEINNESNLENNDFFVINDDAKINKNEYNNYNGNDYVNYDYVEYNGYRYDLHKVEFPSIKRKNLYEDLYNYISKLKNKKGDDDDYNYKIQGFFYKFLVYLFAGYTDYYLNSIYFYESIKSKNCGNDILYKRNNTKGFTDFNFVKEIFNFEEFINKSPKDAQIFYFVFFQTKMFINFLRQRIYINDKVNSMAYKQFDQLTFLKKHEDYRKRKENKGIYENFKKKTQEKIKQEKIKEISITNRNFTDNEKEQIINKDRKMILIKYAQFINIKEEILRHRRSKKKIILNDVEVKNEIPLLINYCLFPKLLFDDQCFNMKYENLFFMHGIDLPNSRTIEEYKSICSKINDDYYQLRKYMFPPGLIDGKPGTNNSKVNFEVTSYYYIHFNWIILLCCSLWYCEPIERIVRLEEILIVLDKLEYIEEIVIKLLYVTFLKYGNKIQCIKALEKIKKFYGYSNYLYLNLLCIKLCEKENENPDDINNSSYYKKYIPNENEENKKNEHEYYFKDRSFILGLESFIQKRISTPVTKSTYSHRMTRSTTNLLMYPRMTKNLNVEKNKIVKENKYKEKIVFSSEQYCPKCQCFNSFDFEEIKKQKLSKIYFYYKCSKCKTIKNDVTIKYQMLLFNKEKKELFITKMGEFKLLPPNRLYQELMYHLTSKKNWVINIENIFTEKQINIINFIYYFSTEGLSFDFLIPYKTLNDESIELIQNNLGAIISDINRRRFSVLEVNEFDKISKSLIMNPENEDFIPIDISNYDHFNRYFDLIPCLNNYYDIYDFNYGEVINETETETETNENEDNNNLNNAENDELNYFTINATKK